MKKENTPLSLPKKQVDLVMGLYSSDKIDETIDMIKALNEDYPNIPLLFNLLGACYNKLGQFDPAAQFFETAISLKPDYAEAFLNHGIVMREVGKLDHAAKSFKRAVEILPNYFEYDPIPKWIDHWAFDYQIIFVFFYPKSCQPLTMNSAHFYLLRSQNIPQQSQIVIR